MRPRRGTLLLVLMTGLVLLGVACGEPQRVGSERLLEDVDQDDAGGPRLGERVVEEEEETDGEDGASLTVADDPTPPPPAATPKVDYFDVALIANSPFYAPGNHLITSVGVTLRVTNQDETAERPQRSFTADDQSFDSGMLSPGDQYEIKLTRPGRWNIVDRGLPFASAVLEVQ